MKITDIYTQEDLVFSLEFFPPKENIEIVFQTLENLIEFHPRFVSVTSKPDGTNRDKTIDITTLIKNNYDIEGVPHLTCINTTKNEIEESLVKIEKRGMENVLALRGDKPDELKKNHFQYASQLIQQIKKTKTNLCIGVAGYPEKHPESESAESDLFHLKKKVDFGADFIITQMFFDNSYFIDFVDRTQQMNITVPIIPGIMPIFSYKNIHKFSEMCGVEIPHALRGNIEKYQDDTESIIQLGIDFTVQQCKELLTYNIPGLHFYTMNRTVQIREILKQLTG